MTDITRIAGHELAAPRNDVDLAGPDSVAHGKDAIAFQHKVEGGRPFRPAPPALRTLSRFRRRVPCHPSAFSSSSRW